MLLKDHVAASVAVALWILNILSATAWCHDVGAAHGRVIGGAAVTVSIWALLRHYRSPRTGPDKIVMSIDDYTRLVTASAVAAKAGLREQNDGGGGRARRPA